MGGPACMGVDTTKSHNLPVHNRETSHLTCALCCWVQDAQPPKAPDMFVRVLQDCGNVAFSTGSVTLKKGSTHFLPQAEADHLIQEGVLAPSESGPIEAFTTPFDYI